MADIKGTQTSCLTDTLSLTFLELAALKAYLRLPDIVPKGKAG
jgi:hypothetical protein